MILHLANDYSGSTVYKNLVAALDHLEVTQTVYTAVRSKELVGKNNIVLKQPESKLIYSPILNTYSRLDFYYKKRIIIKNIQKKVNNISNFHYIHAHTWYSDGTIAFYLHKKYNIPYSVTIRSTDLNLFFKYMYHLRGLGLDILKSSEKIIFISPQYQERFKNHEYIKSRYPDFISKSIVLPNGVDKFWVEHAENRKDKIKNPVQLLFIGTFLKRKNVNLLIDAVIILNKGEMKYVLHLVGGGKDKGRVEKKIQNLDYIKFHGPIFDLNKLKAFINSCDIFVMPSHSETFGLVYIEALSQGIPVIYTTNEGIDGLYGENIGEKVNHKDINSIIEGIQAVATNYSKYNFKPKEIVKNHDWSLIAKKYIQIYNLKK